MKLKTTVNHIFVEEALPYMLGRELAKSGNDAHLQKLAAGKIATIKKLLASRMTNPNRLRCFKVWPCLRVEGFCICQKACCVSTACACMHGLQCGSPVLPPQMLRLCPHGCMRVCRPSKKRSEQ